MKALEIEPGDRVNFRRRGSVTSRKVERVLEEKVVVWIHGIEAYIHERNILSFERHS